jgi:S-adenosylmethionine hydrolase
MNVITLTTDFGSGDHEAGVLKGVIWKIAPDVHIADLSHDIPPHDILAGALLLSRCVPYFPVGTIHVGVIDPGVGTERRGLAMRLGSQFFVGPDNGLFTLVLEYAEAHSWPIECVCLDQPQYWLPDVKNIFHGRDVFSPVAAHIANGIPITALGTPVSDPIQLPIPQPQRTIDGWQAQIIHIDHFGNLATNLREDVFSSRKDVVFLIKDVKIRGLVNAFGDRQPGELVALFDSSGYLAISVVNGSAAQRLGCKPGDLVEISISQDGP